MKALVLAVAGCFLLASGTAVALEDPIEPPTDPEPWIADYEGVEIDLRVDWDDARACETDGIETTCYDTESEMVAALADEGLTAAPAGASGFKRLSCSSYLRLYTGTGYTGSVLALTTQFAYLNLSSYGFNNVVSSYKVGGCSAAFFDLTNGGAPQYGGATSAYQWSTSMLLGWDNRVSSVFIGA